MIPQVKKILFVTDFSKSSVYAFRYAVLMSELTKAPITIVHVRPGMDPVGEIPVIIHLGEETYRKLTEEKRGEIIQMIKNRLEEFIQRELADDPERERRVSSIEVLDGDPAAVILDMAEHENFDLIVMGSHGKEVVRHTFLGSTAQRILRHTRKPVVVVPMPADVKDLPQWWV